jgi:hypothetical protein
MAVVLQLKSSRDFAMQVAVSGMENAVRGNFGKKDRKISYEWKTL